MKYFLLIFIVVFFGCSICRLKIHDALILAIGATTITVAMKKLI